jgi:sulfite reductase (NADPH) flavoprotein alpha-component
MAFGPRLPENAPFSPSQRAWLDGYIADWFSFAVENGGDQPLPTPAPPQPAEPKDFPPEDFPPEDFPPEDFPWHDPTLSLDERLALAEGRRPERVLMAAMAQLDCGQCGYLCQTYAEAIARGEEKSLGRCAPGGRAISRKLKELTEAGLGNSAAAPLPAAAGSSLQPTPPGSSDKPFAAAFRGADCLNAPGSEKETRQVVLASEGGVADYEVGDSLGVVACNSAELVAATIARLGAKPETPVLSPDGIERPLVEALSERCEIRRPSDQAVEVLASRALDPDESMVLQAEGYPGAGPEDADLLDLLETFPSARPPLSELISALDALQPRLYSIASSPKHVPGEIHLAVAAVRYERRARRRHGVASTFLADRVAVGDTVQAFIRPSHGFRLPALPETPMVMIGPGTGIAPFRAFLQERRALGGCGRNWLFFGNPRRRCDFLFEQELTDYCHDGLLTRLDLAFSRDQPEKIYVQHRMLQHAAELWSWLEDGAHLYVCDAAQRMAHDVEAGMAYIVAQEGCMDAAAAKAYLARLAREGRYQKDIY